MKALNIENVNGKFSLPYSKAKEDPGQAQFDKCLEDFYAVCDQIEIFLVSPSIFIYIHLPSVC